MTTVALEWCNGGSLAHGDVGGVACGGGDIASGVGGCIVRVMLEALLVRYYCSWMLEVLLG